MNANVHTHTHAVDMDGVSDSDCLHKSFAVSFVHWCVVVSIMFDGIASLFFAPAHRMIIFGLCETAIPFDAYHSSHVTHSLSFRCFSTQLSETSG